MSGEDNVSVTANISKIQGASDQDAAPRIRPRQTHTYAELEVSQETYAEIRHLLKEAGWDQAFMDDGGIDMSGIGLVTAKSPEWINFIVNGSESKTSWQKNAVISYDEIYGLVYPERGPGFNPTCTWRLPSGASGILAPGEEVSLEEGMKISMIDTNNA